jgi:general secretion pathway protein K
VKSAACSRPRPDSLRLPQRQRGVALITAVLVVAIATIIATSMLKRQNFDTQRTANIIHHDQAVAYAIGAEHWAGIELIKDSRTNNIDYLEENWAYELPTLPIDGGFITGRLQDLQGRFNLNSVLDPLQAERFSRLCQALGVDPGFIPALQDWIDPDTEERVNGAEDDAYTLLNPPYRAANRYLADTSELLLVRGVSVQDYNTLMFYVNALPGAIELNVNTASPLVLESLVDGVNPADIDGVVAVRANRPFREVDDFVNEEIFAGKGMQEDYLTVSSQYFLLTANVMLGNAPLTLQSVLYRSPTGKITVMQRRFGPTREGVLTGTDYDLALGYQN